MLFRRAAREAVTVGAATDTLDGVVPGTKSAKTGLGHGMSRHLAWRPVVQRSHRRVVHVCLHYRYQVHPILVRDAVLEDHGAQHLQYVATRSFHRAVDPWAVSQYKLLFRLQSVTVQPQLGFEMASVVTDPHWRHAEAAVPCQHRFRRHCACQCVAGHEFTEVGEAVLHDKQVLAGAEALAQVEEVPVNRVVALGAKELAPRTMATLPLPTGCSDPRCGRSCSGTP